MNSLSPHLWKVPLALVAIPLLISCGGGGGSDITALPSLRGMAAVGAPMSGATVTLKDSEGHTFTTTADSGGAYNFTDLTGAVAPFQIQATATMGEADVTHYAIVAANTANAVANVTPLTTAITALISPTDIPVPLTVSQLANIGATDISAAANKVSTVIAPLVANLNLPVGFDPVKTSFVANGKGADLLLDHLDVVVRPEGVTIANKMAVVLSTDPSTVATGSQIVKNSSAAPAALTQTAVTNTDGFDELAAKFTACFTVAAANRLVASSASDATLHLKCQGIADSNYLHNGMPFMNRWASGFRSSTMDGAVFARPVVRLRLSASPERMAVNFNFKDNLGAGYTRPEIIERQIDDTWLLVGNQRAFNGYVESALTYYNDLSNLPFNNVNSSRVDAGFRISFDPRVYLGDNGSVTYPALDLTVSGGFGSSTWESLYSAKPSNVDMVGCIVVRGPGEMVGAKWAGFHPNGILLKRPTGSPIQDYMGIDRTVTNGWRGAIDRTSAQATGSAAAPSYTPTGGVLQSNICGNSKTDSSSSTYVTDIQALGTRVNVFTGAVDSGIAGRDVAWNTGPRYARLTPSSALAATLDSNPVIKIEVFDTTGRLRHSFATRYLGQLPPASMAKTYFDNNMVSVINTDSLKRYLDFAAGATTTQQTVTGSANVEWSTPAGAFGADRIGLYSEIYRAQPGLGTRGPLSTRTGDNTQTSSLWSSDPELAAALDVIPGTSFYWWHGSFAKLAASGDTLLSCAGSTSLVSTSGVNVGRSMTSIGSGNRYPGYLFGTDQLSDACTVPGTDAYVHREVFTTTYTDTNTRLYVFTANKALRSALLP